MISGYSPDLSPIPGSPASPQWKKYQVTTPPISEHKVMKHSESDNVVYGPKAMPFEKSFHSDAAFDTGIHTATCRVTQEPSWITSEYRESNQLL